MRDRGFASTEGAAIKTDTGSTNGTGKVVEYNSSPSTKRLAVSPITPDRREILTSKSGWEGRWRRNREARESVTKMVQGI